MPFSDKPGLKSNDEVELEPMGPVGLREYQEAKDHLKRNSGFDFDSFVDEIRKGRLFEEPLGPSSNCLSVNQIAGYAEAADGTRAMESHLTACDICRENVEAYRILALRHAVEKETVPA